MSYSLDAHLNNQSRIKLSYVTVHCCWDVNKEQTAQNGISLRMYHLHPPTDNSELFLKWEEAVTTSPGGTGTMCYRSHFLLRMFVVSLPPASPPHPERWTWSSTNLSDPGLEEGSRKHSTNACKAGRWNTAQASRWEGNLVPHSEGRSQTEEPPGVHQDWWLVVSCAFFSATDFTGVTTGNARSSSRKRRQQFLSWTRTKVQKISRTPDTEVVTLGPQSWLCGDVFLLPNLTTGVCFLWHMRQEKTNSHKFFSDFLCSDFTCMSVHKK